MRDDQKRESGKPDQSFGNFAIWAVALCMLLYGDRQGVGRVWRDVLGMGVGTLIALATLLDFRKGITSIAFKTIERSEEPIDFWIVTTIIGIALCLLFFGSLGDLLGLWKF